MNQQAFIVGTAEVAMPTANSKVDTVKSRPLNEKMDALTQHIQSSGKFTFDASHARLVEAMKHSKART